ncbi:MAG: hypothetical protein P4L53_03580 [Candidatus Obscuribacterales bacterium]|nr:hypothetical protein [Candidatus Obscuribacterales bacterium]
MPEQSHEVGNAATDALRPKLEVICSDKESRALLEQLKVSCHKGWFFETFRIESQGYMVYKFLLLDLDNQKSIDNEQYVRYLGWVEASESEDSVVVRPSGSLENFLSGEIRSLLIKRFHDDMLEPVCRRQRMRVIYSK